MLCSFFASSSSRSFPPAASCGGCCVECDASLLITNSSQNLTVASTSGIATPPVSGPPASRCLFKSLNFLNKSQNGGECTSNCNTEFAKHIPPVFTSPRARNRGSVALPDVREGVALLGERDDKGDAGMDKPTMDEAGIKELKAGWHQL